jgi:hypothetical protein
VAPEISSWRANGELYLEVEVCEAKGEVFVGFAGANFTAESVGDDDKSWAFSNLYGGSSRHK